MSKRVSERIKSGLRVFRKVLEEARNADRSEQDTVTIVRDMLADVFGYDKYSEVTGEYSIRGTFCDLAVKVDGKVKYLIEVKAVDKSLNDNHLRQATDYAAKEGIEWVVLTNGIEWQAYRMIFEQPVRYEHVFTMDMLSSGNELTEQVFMFSREGITKDMLEEYHEQKQILNRHIVSAILLSEPVLKSVRRELRSLAPKMKIEVDQIKDLFETEILKRNIIEGPELKDAIRKLSRAKRRQEKKKVQSASIKEVPVKGIAPAQSEPLAAEQPSIEGGASPLQS